MSPAPDDPIVLSEYGWSSFQLDLEDVDFLRGLKGKPIEVVPAFDQPEYLLNPGPHSGVVMLPSGRRVECRPKVPIRNFFYMLAVSFDLEPSFLDEAATFQRIDEVFEFVIRYFAELVDRRIRDGLYRNYRETEDNLAVVRGRIGFDQDIRLNHILRHRTYCRFTEFTWDIPENQIIRQIVDLVRHWATKPDVRGELLRVHRLLGEVTPTQHSARVIDGFTYHRLNDDYEPIHKLCRLFLEGSTLSEDEGIFEFRTFLFNMNELFERFVTAALRQRLPHGLQLIPQQVIHLDDDHHMRMRPDILIRERGMSILVADCKYKRLGEEEFKHPDNYQMLAYCTALGLERGILIYPKHEVDVQMASAIQRSPVRIEQITVDLGVERGLLDAELDRLAAATYSQLNLG
jgi:5-methylcytosine-specific restriction enzyme subunit McrC